MPGAKKTTKKRTRSPGAAAAVPTSSSAAPSSAPATPEPSAAARLSQAEDALKALLQYVHKKESEAQASALLTETTPIFVSVQLMQSLPKGTSKRRTPVLLPHGIYNQEDEEVCLITTSPQRAWKDKVFPLDQLKNIKKVIDMNKLRAKFKSFEAKRQLASQFNAFIADEAVMSFLPKLLGKPFFSRSKEPVCVNMRRFPKCLEDALASTSYSIQDNELVSILLGRSSFTPQKLADNCRAVLDRLVKDCPNGWRDVHSILVKSSDSPGLPIYAHNFIESKDNPLTPSNFPQRIKLSVPELDKEEKAAKKAKKQQKEEEEEEADEDAALSDLSLASDDEDEEDA